MEYYCIVRRLVSHFCLSWAESGGVENRTTSETPLNSSSLLTVVDGGAAKTVELDADFSTLPVTITFG